MLWLAGILGGALMGMIFVAHLSVMFALRPPAVVRNRAPESTLLPVVMVMTLFSFTTWLGLGIGGAVVFNVVRGRLSVAAPGMPSVVYTAGVVGLALLLLAVLLLRVRGRATHIIAELALFIGIFGWLIPAMVSAG